MVTKKEILIKYGKTLGNEILKDDFMRGITVSINKDGEFDIPECDVERALKHIQGKHISDLEWD